MDILSPLVLSALRFGRTTIGLITRPYETYRSIVHHGVLWEMVWVWAVISLYFAIATIVRTPIFRPFFLTKHFLSVLIAAIIGYLLISCSLWVIGRFLNGKGSFREMLLAWGYTLVPSVLWFLATSLLYVLIPPPRTTSLAGISFSILYLVFSATLFFWKVTLAYLSLRFGMRLDLAKITVVTAVTLPIIGLYSYAMYSLGIFKVPFV